MDILNGHISITLYRPDLAQVQGACDFIRSLGGVNVHLMSAIDPGNVIVKGFLPEDCLDAKPLAIAAAKIK